MRILPRFLPTLLLVVAGIVVVHFFGWPWQWVDIRFGGTDGSGGGGPTKTVTVSSLPQ